MWVVFGDQIGNAPNTVTFDVMVNNAGPSVATGVTVSVDLLAGVSLVSAVPAPETTYNAGTGIWTIGTIELSTKFLTIDAMVDYSAVPQTVTASILDSDHFDPDTTCNSAFLVITDRADVAVTVSVDRQYNKSGSSSVSI